MGLGLRFMFLPLILMLFLLAAVGFLGLWVYRDAKARGLDAAMWTVIVIFVPSFIGLLLYFLVGRPHTEVICPHCGAQTDGSKPYCANCGEPLTGVAPTVQPVAKWPLIVGLVCFALPIVYMIVIAGILIFVPRFH